MKHPRLAFLLLVNAVAANNVWKLAPATMQADVWNISGALSTVLLLLLVGLVFDSPEVWLVVALGAGFSLQTAACSSLYLIDPWPVAPNEEMCSAKAHFPLGTVGLWVSICLALILKGKYGRR